MYDYTQFYIDGAWVDPVTTNTIPVENPATEETIGHISLGSVADVDKAVAAARRAFESWQFSTREERLELMRSIAAGTGVGYGLAFTAERPSRIATLAVGYADGWPRRLGGRAAAWFQGQPLPIVGRVSMDSMTVDASDLAADELAEGDYVELIGEHAPLETVAEQAETIPYEILTGLGARLSRVYLGTDALEAPQ